MNMWKLISVALCGTSAVRKKRAQLEGAATKLLGGVPILNYHLAYQTASSDSLVEGESPQEDWIVVFNKEVKDEFLEKLCSTAKCMRTGHPSKGGVPFFQIHGTEQELESMLEAAGSSVKFVEPDAKAYIMAERHEKGWPGPRGPKGTKWGLERIGAADRPSEGEGVNVYVMDSGVLASHTDFGGRVIPTLDMSRRFFKECRGKMDCAPDTFGQGTHVAGVAAGATFGVASKATVRSVKVLADDLSFHSSWICDALDWVATKGPRPAVANMDTHPSNSDREAASEAEAVESAIDAGVVVVVSAGGTEDGDPCESSPASVPSAITVGATMVTDAMAFFGRSGRCVDIWAPGEDILTASHTSVTESADEVRATIMAAAHVSGASALLLEAAPEMVASDVLSLLLKNAVTNGVLGLSDDDNNKLLYVGKAGAPPTPAPTPLPPCPDGTSGPDKDGYCSCKRPLFCWENGKEGCNVNEGYPYYRPSRHHRRFHPSCVDCQCIERSCPENTVLSAPHHGNQDCECVEGTWCQLNGTHRCPTGDKVNENNPHYFSYACKDCKCTNVSPAK